MRSDQVDTDDIVRLVAGGPDMTVIRVVGDRVFCEWTEHGKCFARDYSAKLLTAPPPAGGSA